MLVPIGEGGRASSQCPHRGRVAEPSLGVLAGGGWGSPFAIPVRVRLQPGLPCTLQLPEQKSSSDPGVRLGEGCLDQRLLCSGGGTGWGRKWQDSRLERQGDNVAGLSGRS